MGVSDIGDSQFLDVVESKAVEKPDDLAAQGSYFNDMYPFGIPEGNLADVDASQGDATFDFDGFDFGQHAFQGVDGGFTTPDTPQSSFTDQRYVSCPSQSQTHLDSRWRPLEQPVQQFQYPDPDIFAQPQIAPVPYYPPQPLLSANTLTPQNFGAITPPGQQLSSINRPLFLHGNMGPPPATAGMFLYEPIQTYHDDGAFNPEDLALSDIPEDLVATAIREDWALPGDSAQQSVPVGNHTQQRPPLSDDLFIPDTRHDSDSDGEFEPSSSARAKRPRRNKPSEPQAILPNGEVKKGRPCAKPQTEERRCVNERRMQGYYRRKYDQGNLEKARKQSKESYWRRKQRRIEAGEKVRSYNAPKRGKLN